MPANTAAWLPAKHARLQVGPAPYTAPGANEIAIRNHAVAVNPVDWIKQLIGDIMFGWLKYPIILGSDVAGEVVEVGPGVTRFKAGDRVLGHALGMSKARNTPAEGGFQHYTVLMEHMASPIPATLSYERAAVLPLGLSTAACALFQNDHLALQLPSAAPKSTGKTVLVWGGSTSVGSNAIQLAVAAGYAVVTTASPHNFAYVKSLGAGEAFDYNSPTVVGDIVRVLKGRTIAGAVAIGTGSAGPCLDIVHRCKGDKVVSTASPAISFDGLADGGGVSLQFISLMLKMASSGAGLAFKARRRGIRTKFIFGDTLADNEVGPAIYQAFLPRALADGRYVAAPDPLIVGQGLEVMQAALDTQRKGVSAKKVVVALQGS